MVSHDTKKVHSLWFKGFHDVLEKNIDQPGTNKEDSTHELLQDYYGPRLLITVDLCVDVPLCVCACVSFPQWRREEQRKSAAFLHQLCLTVLCAQWCVLGLGCTGYGCCYSCHPRRLEKGEMDTTTWSILVLEERRVNIAIYLQGSHALQSQQIIESDTYVISSHVKRDWTE